MELNSQVKRTAQIGDTILEDIDIEAMTEKEWKIMLERNKDDEYVIKIKPDQGMEYPLKAWQHITMKELKAYLVRPPNPHEQ